MTLPQYKKIALLRGITSNHDGHFYRLICPHLIITKNKVEFHKKVWEENILYIAMTYEDTEILRVYSILEI